MTGQAMADNGGPRGPILEIRDLTHRFGEVVAVDHVSLAAEQGEFLTILGESGSGKTTLLRVISGLETPSEVGTLRIAGADVSKTPASDRNCTTVFQHYALFPHMAVGENVGYGLKVRGVVPRERELRSREALDLVRLGGMYDRRVHQLSGGERQRVALARALVTRPAILLLDEPLGALDEKLRLEMQVELLELHNKLGMTFIYITHSQEEALTMSNRVILMRQGRIVQEGPPRDLFDRPVSRFVADFMGVENLLDGALEGAADGAATARLGEHTVHGRWCGTGAPRVGEPVCVCVRAEGVHFATGGGAEPNRIACQPGATIYKGKYIDQTLETGVGVLNARIWDRNLDLGSVSHVWWHEEDCVIVPTELAGPRVT
jgi:ABC-type Fe3+/spermidine/putrescine transport system ATPase subunit